MSQQKPTPRGIFTERLPLNLYSMSAGRPAPNNRPGRSIHSPHAETTSCRRSARSRSKTRSRDGIAPPPRFRFIYRRPYRLCSAYAEPCNRRRREAPIRCSRSLHPRLRHTHSRECRALIMCPPLNARREPFRIRCQNALYADFSLHVFGKI